VVEIEFRRKGVHIVKWKSIISDEKDGRRVMLLADGGADRRKGGEPHGTGFSRNGPSKLMNGCC